jgi:hypothetical protein
VENLRLAQNWLYNIPLDEVRRQFTMTVHVSGREFLDDPVAATRRVLILALAQIPAKIHEKQVDNESSYKSMSNKRIETHFNGILNDPKNLTSAGESTPSTCGNGGRLTFKKIRSRNLGSD